MNHPADTAWIVEQAKALGFDLCGVVRAEKFPELQHSPEWLARGYHGEMDYLADSRRSDPRAAMPGVQSVIVCLLNYQTALPLSTESDDPGADDEPRGWISRYAWGDDYHEIIRQKLDALIASLHGQFRDAFQAKCYVDTGPLNERVLAKYAGLGWLGKNTLLLHPTMGSYFFLGVILTTLELPATLPPQELPPPDLCGTCRRCLDACPTQAFVEPYVMDARKCISYLTIELRGAIAEEYRKDMGNHVFGCDICQDVCPWNRRAPISTTPQFQPRAFPSAKQKTPEGSQSAEGNSLYLPRMEWLLNLNEEDFRKFFARSALKRTKWRGLVRNACIALGNSGITRNHGAHARICASLKRLAASREPVLAESANWALSRIQ